MNSRGETLGGFTKAERNSAEGYDGRLMYLGEIPPTRETTRAVLEHVDGKGWSEEGYRAFKGLDLGVINGKSRAIGFD
jgi:hypothetical protein